MGIENQLVYNNDGEVLARAFVSSREFPTPEEYSFNYPVLKRYEIERNRLLTSVVDSLPEDQRIVFEAHRALVSDGSVVAKLKQVGEEYGNRVRGKPFSVGWVYTRKDGAYRRIGREHHLQLYIPFVQESIATNIWGVSFPIELNDHYPRTDFINARLADLKLSAEMYQDLDGKHIIGKWLVEEAILMGSYKLYLPRIRLLNFVSQPVGQLSSVEASRLRESMNSLERNTNEL